MDFETLLAEAEKAAFSGWDFSYLANRWHDQPTSWDYKALVLERLADATALLDMGTGGGEFLTSLAPHLPALTVATEAYAPNVPLAQERLSPLGVEVVSFTDDEYLPLAAQQFDLIINRHESFSPREIRRLLKPGGRFLTQQVGGLDNLKLNRLLGADDPEYFAWDLASAVAGLEAAGLEITDAREEFPVTTISDVGAIVYYLKAIPWQVPDFSAEKYHDALLRLHQQILTNGPLEVRSHRFLIEVKHV